MFLLFLLTLFRAGEVFFTSVINQIDAQNFLFTISLFHALHVSSTCAHHQEVKIALHSLWYHYTYPEAVYTILTS